MCDPSTQATNRTNYIHCPDDILLELLFFSTFESLDLHQWSEQECRNFMSLPQRPFSLWNPARTCVGEHRYFPYF